MKFWQIALSLACVSCGGRSRSNTPQNQEVRCSSQADGSLSEVFTGIATYYNATGAGNCSFDPSPDDLAVAALNAPQYANAAWCGACAEVAGALGSVTVRIVDQCPECATGHLDLSREAFAKIDAPAKGRVPITWKFVSCPVKGPVSFKFQSGSSRYWAGIQVRNHRLPLSRFEVKAPTGWKSLIRESYNFFTAPEGLGENKTEVRMTACDGSEILEEIPMAESEGTAAGTRQF